jgi:site-specific DNA recombinase
MFHIISAFAEFERDVIGERTKFGMEKKASDGAIVNRAPLGYKIVNKLLIIDKEKQSIVNEIFIYFLENKISLNKLAKRYDYSPRGMKKLLQNQTYLGKVKFDGKWNKGIHKAIISSKLFSKVQNKLKTSNQKLKPSEL